MVKESRGIVSSRPVVIKCIEVMVDFRKQKRCKHLGCRGFEKYGIATRGRYKETYRMSGAAARTGILKRKKVKQI